MNLPEDTYSQGPLPSEQDAISDIKYFTDKLKACEESGDIEGASTYKRRLALMEDALVIYRLIRTPDISVKTYDFGSLSKEDAEKYVQELIKKYREKKLLDPPITNE